MLQRGRKSSAALALIGEAGSPVLPRLKAPPSLTDAQRAIWQQVVNAKPAEWFGPEQIPLLEGYCRHAVNAAVLAQEIDGCDPAWLKDDDGLRRHERLLAMHEREVRAASSLATRLRMTNQAITDTETFGQKARRRASTTKPWQAE